MMNERAKIVNAKPSGAFVGDRFKMSDEDMEQLRKSISVWGRFKAWLKGLWR